VAGRSDEVERMEEGEEGRRRIEREREKERKGNRKRTAESPVAGLRFIEEREDRKDVRGRGEEIY